MRISKGRTREKISFRRKKKKITLEEESLMERCLGKQTKPEMIQTTTKEAGG